MATTTNPFEPPRTTDLDATSGDVPGRVSPAALRELEDAAPWVRRLVRLSALVIVLSVASVGIDLARRFRITTTTAVVVANIVVSILFLRILRWYEGASTRLQRGDASALRAVVDAQASYFKLAGVVVTLATGLFAVYLAYGVATGRWLSWMHS